jgi:hypothetical protein
MNVTDILLQKSESELSVLIDEPPKKKRMKDKSKVSLTEYLSFKVLMIWIGFVEEF